METVKSFKFDGRCQLALQKMFNLQQFKYKIQKTVKNLQISSSMDFDKYVWILINIFTVYGFFTEHTPRQTLSWYVL